jgi:hypothetical protein
MDSEQDDLDAAYAQQENEERRHWEERILARSKLVTEQFKRINAEWDAYWDDALRRLP